MRIIGTLVDCFFFYPDGFCFDWYVDCYAEVSVRNFLGQLVVESEWPDL